MKIIIMYLIVSSSFSIYAGRHCSSFLGQSNIVGATAIPSQFTFPTLANQIPRVQIFGNDDLLKVYSDPYDDPTGQVDMVSYDALYYPGFGVGAGYGPARMFSKTITEQRTDINLIIIPCGKGASSISQWQRNLSPSTLYGSCLRRIKKLISLIRCESLSIIFYQGEQEAGNSFLPTTWTTQFTQMVNDLRIDLLLPSLPVVYVKLPQRTVPHPWVPYWNDVRSNQMLVSMTGVYRVDFEDIDMTTNLSNLYDSMHLSVSQYDIVGERLANTLLPIIP